MFKDKSKTIVERIANQDAKINELVDEMNKSVEIVNGYTTDEETRVANEQVRIEYYNQRKEEINSINEQLDNIESKKADKTTTNNIQQQVNNLVLGAVGDGNNAEVVQARNGSRLLNDRLNHYDSLLNYKYINILTSSQRLSITGISGFTNVDYIDSEPITFDFNSMNPLDRIYIGQKYNLTDMVIGKRYFAMGTARLIQGGGASVGFNNIGTHYSPKNFGVDMSSNLSEGGTYNPLTSEWTRFGVMFDWQEGQTGLEFVVNSSSKNAIIEVKELMLFDVGDIYENSEKLNDLYNKGYIYDKIPEFKEENRIKHIEDKTLIFENSLSAISKGFKNYNLISDLNVNIIGEYTYFNREKDTFTLTASSDVKIRTAPLELEVGKSYYIVVRLLEGGLYGYSNNYFTLNRIEAGLYRDATNVLNVSEIIKRTDNILIYKYTCPSIYHPFYGGLGNTHNGYTYSYTDVKISLAIIPEEYYIDEYSTSNVVSINDSIGAVHPNKSFELFDKSIMYFSEHGDDSNSGVLPNCPKKSIDKWLKNGNITCLLKSGDTFYTSLTIGSNTTLSSYGGNKKPIISGVRKSNNKLVSIGNNLYSVTLECFDVGFIRFLGESDWNMKRKVVSDSNVQDGEYHFDKSTKTLKIYSIKDISNMYIEYTDGSTGIAVPNGVKNVLIDNIEVYGFGVHGIEPNINTDNITIENCYVHLIGGSFLPYQNIKLGNGIQIWMYNSNNIFVRNNVVEDCYDAGLTHQFTGTASNSEYVTSKNIVFEKNIVKRCFWNLECYNGCDTQDCHVVVKDNIFLDGLDITNGYRENSDTPNQALMLLRTTRGSNDIIEIKDNIFIKSSLHPVAFSLGNAVDVTVESDRYKFSNNIIACHTDKIYKYPPDSIINSITSNDIIIINHNPKTFEEMCILGYVNGELSNKLTSITKF